MVRKFLAVIASLVAVTALVAPAGAAPRELVLPAPTGPHRVGVMLPDIRNPFFPEILDGLTESLRDTDYQVLLGPGGNGEDAEARVTEAMIDRGMDGMVLIAPISPAARLEQSPRPCRPS